MRNRTQQHLALGDALRALPPLTPPERWSQIAARVEDAARGRDPGRDGVAPTRTLASRPALFAMAAATLAAVALAWFVLAPGAERAPGGIAHSDPVPPPASATTTAQQPGEAPTQVDALVSRSAYLERQLAALNARAPAVTRLGHEADSALLQARLWALDTGHAQLARDADTGDLRQLYWHERVRLLDSMVNIERAEYMQRDAPIYRSVPVSY